MLRSARTTTSRRRRSPARRARVLPREASDLLVGGVNSPVRAFRQTGGAPLMLVRAHGASVVDTTGRAYLDFIMGWGATILGHQPAVITRALARGMRAGVLMGLTHPAEVELARLIAEAVPSVEQVRFTVSGTEAGMTAVRLARGITGRAKILTFEGCYHGHGESVLAGKGPGSSPGIDQGTVTVAYNDPAVLEQAMTRHAGELACVIVEPVAANMGVVVPQPGYLARMRELTHRHGILLIFDEVVTGFRLGPGGAQQAFGVTPDLTTFGKIIGGGLPIGAVGGPRRLMGHLTPEGEVFHGGTFAGHPLTMAAGVATLKELAARPPYERLEHLCASLTDELRRVAAAAGVAIQINRVASLFTLFFAQQPVRNAAEARASHRDQFAVWAESLRQQGILVPPSPFEAVFLSSAHTTQDVKQCVQAAARAFRAVRSARP